MKILVVDDSKVMRHIIRNHLAALGFANIREARSGREALAVLEQEPIDLIFSDWVMPGMFGIDLLRQVRANAATREIPFVMVTAEAQPHLIFEAIQAKVSDYVVKPFTRDALRQSMEKVFRFSGGPAPETSG
ncbi:MAG TPA: response regulator [Desulfurivibrionaceae bacterium]|nr:response regulator [Desulfurivibrionaceae bacterium]